jgi:RimJ/RimL family protein N-acetyltransferase
MARHLPSSFSRTHEMFDQTVSTERLVLRRYERRDTTRIAALLNNWNVVRMLAMVPFPYTLADAEDYLGKQLARTPEPENFTSAITIGADLIGVIGVGPRNDAPSIGYWLGEPYWGQGYMTEALRAATRQFFATSAWDRLGSGIFEDNPASLAVQRKLGFEIVGESMMLCVARGEQVRHFDTRLTQAQFEARAA